MPQPLTDDPPSQATAPATAPATVTTTVTATAPATVTATAHTPASVPAAHAPVAAAAVRGTGGVKGVDPALVVILGGVCAALHVGKLPPAIPALQQALGLSLVQAGFLLSMVQLAGMCAGLAFGALADGLGARRSMLVGLVVLAVASAAGAGATTAPWLMALRASEGFGFLLVVLAAPALVRRLVAPERLSLMLGLWGAYMPLGTTLALLGGPLLIGALGWPAWWAALSVLSAAMAIWLARRVPAPSPAAVAPQAQQARQPGSAPVAPQPGASIAAQTLGSMGRAFGALRRQLPITLRAGGPWLLAVAFAVYSGQWLAVIGFLPTVYAAAGVAPASAGLLTALVAAANMAGNVVAGRLLHRGARPVRLLRVGYTTMMLAALVAFAPWAWPGAAAAVGAVGGPAADATAWVRYAAALAFSGVGGLVPATLFTLAVPATPRAGSLSSTAGWMQQWSAAGQFFGPPLVAWVAAAVGGWHLTWVATGACALAGLALSAGIARVVALGTQGAPVGARAPRS
ncbi:MAG: MFS transporter [Rubrivivax sp.]|nr:MFS transporter [Rubrivivax sp.]